MKIVFNPQEDIVRVNFKGTDVTAKISGMVYFNFEKRIVKDNIKINIDLGELVATRAIIDKIEEEFRDAVVRNVLTIVNLDELLKDILSKYEEQLKRDTLSEEDTYLCKKVVLKNINEIAGDVVLTMHRVGIVVCYLPDNSIKRVLVDEIDMTTNQEDFFMDFEVSHLLSTYLTQRLSGKDFDKELVQQAFIGFVSALISCQGNF